MDVPPGAPVGPAKRGLQARIARELEWWSAEDRQVSLVAKYDESWPRQFEEAAEEIKGMLGGTVVEIHHVGSTAVDTILWSKPVLDVIVEVKNLADLDGSAANRLEECGLEARGEYGIPGRRYFVKRASSSRLKLHVHCYEQADPRVRRHLIFRDYLRCHPAAAAAYSNLKKQLASAHGQDQVAYQAGKAEFIARIERIAEKVANRQGAE
jgi:GrpB-like predicted nucleotidyltransferase (UPF0157 family)